MREEQKREDRPSDLSTLGSVIPVVTSSNVRSHSVWRPTIMTPGYVYPAARYTAEINAGLHITQYIYRSYHDILLVKTTINQGVSQTGRDWAGGSLIIQEALIQSTPTGPRWAASPLCRGAAAGPQRHSCQSCQSCSCQAGCESCRQDGRRVEG